MINIKQFDYKKTDKGVAIVGINDLVDENIPVVLPNRADLIKSGMLKASQEVEIGREAFEDIVMKIASSNHVDSLIVSHTDNDELVYSSSDMSGLFTLYTYDEKARIEKLDQIDKFSFDTIDLNNLDVSQVKSMNSLFYAADIYDLKIRNWDTHNVEDMRDMFSELKDFNYLDLSGWDVSNVRNMSGMFANSEYLQLDTLENWDTSNVKDMSYMFAGNYRMSKIEGIENWDTRKVRDMSGMFNDATQLESLDLSGWDVSEVRNMSGMFDNASELTTIDLTGWDTKNVTNMSKMFKNAWAIEDIPGVENLDMSNVKDMSGMFMSTYQLGELDASKWNLRKLNRGQELFAHSAVFDLKVPDAPINSRADLDKAFKDTGLQEQTKSEFLSRTKKSQKAMAPRLTPKNKRSR